MVHHFFISKKAFTLAIGLSLLFGTSAMAQKQELGFSLGGIVGQDRSTAAGGKLRLGAGTAMQIDYEHRFFRTGPAEFYVGAHFLAAPQRLVDSTDRSLTRDVATIYVTPNIMVKFHPEGRVKPWAVIGGGYGDYEQSLTTLNGAKNPASRELARGVFAYGGGVDVPVWKFIALRGEIRDFYTGSPALNAPVSGGLHNVVAGAGFVVRFGSK